MLSIEEYHKEYLKTHPTQEDSVNFNNKTKIFLKLDFLISIIKSYKTHLLITTLIFTFSLNFIVLQFKEENFGFEIDSKTNNIFLKQKEDFSPDMVNNIDLEKKIDSKNLLVNNFSDESVIIPNLENELIKVSELKDLLIVQIVQFKNSSLPLENINIENLNLNDDVFVIAMGSKDIDKFNPKQQIDLIEYLIKIIEIKIHQL